MSLAQDTTSAADSAKSPLKDDAVEELTWQLLGSYRCDEESIARLIGRLLRGRLRWTTDQTRFYVWAGSVWAKDNHKHSLTRALIRSLRKSFGRAQHDLGKQLVKESNLMAEFIGLLTEKHKGTSGEGMVASLVEAYQKVLAEKFQRPYEDVFKSDRRIGCSVSLLTYHTGLFEQASNLDDPKWFVVQNGVIDAAALLAGEWPPKVLPHSPSRFVSRMAGAAFDPDATCPLFEKFLAQMVADEEQRKWLLQRTGCALLGHQARKGFVNLIGETDSGKSVYNETMSTVGGDYAKAVKVDLFLQKHESNRFADHTLMGARYVFCGEPDPRKQLDEGFIKLATGRDSQETEAKFEAPVQWKPMFTPFITSNHALKFETSDVALFNRYEPIVCRIGYKPGEKDDLIEQKLAAERDGILALLLRSASGLENGMPPMPQSMRAEQERVAEKVDRALAYLGEQMAEGLLWEDTCASPGACVSVGDLYSRFMGWMAMESPSARIPGKKEFSERIGRRYPVVRSNGSRFEGLVSKDSLNGRGSGEMERLPAWMSAG